MTWLFILAAIALIAILWLVSLPGRYEVVRSHTIRAPKQQVFDIVRDFSQFPAWSPWLIHDPQTQLTMDQPTQVGGSYAWRSPKMGEGQWIHRRIEPLSFIETELVFTKPFKSVSDVRFEFSDAAQGHTQLTWRMQAQLPFFMRPMLPMFRRMIGMDFELGLAMLAGLVDPQDAHPRIEFVGTVDLPADTVLTHAYSGTLAGMKTAMSEAYPPLFARAGAHATGLGWGIYHRIRPTEPIDASTVKMDMAVSVQPGTPGANIRGAGRYFHARLHGDYRFLGPAWNAAYGQARMRKLKWSKSHPALEAYPTNPAEHPNSNDWITDIYVPVR